MRVGAYVLGKRETEVGGCVWTGVCVRGQAGVDSHPLIKCVYMHTKYQIPAIVRSRKMYVDAIAWLELAQIRCGWDAGLRKQKFYKQQPVLAGRICFKNCGATRCILHKPIAIYVCQVHHLQHRSTSDRGRQSYLDIGEEHFEHVGGWVAGVKEHQLGLLQVVGRQTLLNLMRRALRKQIWVHFQGFQRCECLFYFSLGSLNDW